MGILDTILNRRSHYVAGTPVPVPQLASQTGGASGNGPQPANKAGKSTSNHAQGLANANIVPAEDDVEYGSSQPTRILEIVPELVSPYSRSLVYARMMNDTSVDVSMRAYKTPILGAQFYVDSYDNLPINVEISKFISDNLFGGMNAPFLNSLEDICHFFEDGYAVLEKVHELRTWTPPGDGRNTKQYTMLKKLGVRAPQTVKEIHYDNNGGPLELIQGAIQADGTNKDVTIPITKLAIFTFGRKGGDLTGKSLLRTAYENWYYKKHFYKIDGVQKERHGIGVPRGKLLAGYKPKDKEALRTALRNLRTNEESFIIQVPNVEIDFAEIKNVPVDALESAAHHNAMILLNVMATFMAMGIDKNSGSGSRATGGTQSDIFMKALKFIANYICDIINMYIIPELVIWNYPTTSFPKLKVRNIGETRDLQMLGAAIANLVNSEAVTTDIVLENWIREVFDMPQTDDAARSAAIATKAAAKPAPFGGTPNDKPAGSAANNGSNNPNGKPTTTGNTGKPVNAPG